MLCVLYSGVFIALPSMNAMAEQKLPYIGTDAENPDTYDATVKDAGRKLKWDLRYIDDTYASISHEGMDELAMPPRNITVLVITLQIQSSLKNIIAGERDEKLKRIAQQMADWQKKHPYVMLILRPFHEMNGDWYPWGFKKGHNGNSVSQFVPAWKHVRTAMRAEFPELPFMWCPNTLLGRDDKFAAYYPGNDQVEYLCLDGYNHSSVFGGWHTIGQVFNPSLAAIRAMPGMDANKPIVIAETATTEPDATAVAKGHSKAEWFSDMGHWLRNEAPGYGVIALLYFNYNKPMNNKPADYLIYDSSLPSGEASRDAFRKAIADSK